MIAIREDFGLLGIVEVSIESGPSLPIRQDGIDAQRPLDGGARGLEVGGQIHPRIQGAEELGLVAHA